MSARFPWMEAETFHDHNFLTARTGELQALFLFLHFAVALPRAGGSKRPVGHVLRRHSLQSAASQLSSSSLLARDAECSDSLALRAGEDAGRAFPEVLQLGTQQSPWRLACQASTQRLLAGPHRVPILGRPLWQQQVSFCANPLIPLGWSSGCRACESALFGGIGGKDLPDA